MLFAQGPDYVWSRTAFFEAFSSLAAFAIVSANLFYHESKVAKAKGVHRECYAAHKKIGPRCLLNESNAGPTLRRAALSGLAVF